MPSMIPQPVASSSKPSTPVKSKNPPTLRQPQWKPAPTPHIPAGRVNANDAMNTPSRFPTTHHRRSSSQLTAVALADTPLAPLPHEPHEQETVSTPSFPSIMSLQTLTNWWSPGSTRSPTANFKQSASNNTRKPVEKKFISREKQLEKLRSRLDQERRAKCLGHPVQVDSCRACGTGNISL